MCSPTWLLSFYAGFAVIGVAAILISIVSENWIEYQVNRREILNAFNREPELNIKLKDAFNKNSNYFSRSQGLFFVCFADLLPSESGTFTKPVTGGHCLNSYDYFPPDGVTELYTKDQGYHLLFVRLTALFFILGLVCVAFCLLTGMAGCWTRTPKILGYSLVFSLVAVMLTAAAVACWHATQHYEQEVLDVAPYYRSWEPVLKTTTHSHYSWAYVVAWAGICFLGVATILLFFAWRSLKKEQERDLCAKQGYIMPSYFDQKAMIPYNYNTYGGYGAYPYYNQYNSSGYYGYMTYGR